MDDIGPECLHAGRQAPHRQDAAVAGRRRQHACLPMEPDWRRPGPERTDPTERSEILMSRWFDPRTSPRRSSATSPPDRHVIGVCLRRSALRLSSGGRTIFEGSMGAGMVHVSRPGQTLLAEFTEPCDFVHLHVCNGYLGEARAGAIRDLGDLGDGIIRDALTERLCRSLLESEPVWERDRYVDSIGRTIVLRLLVLREPRSSVHALQAWRLRRVQAHIDARLAGSLRLEDLARVAGLSRMHFAAQFRSATGLSPHDFVVARRIEKASVALAEGGMPIVEVALSVGFASQAHFTTAFRQATGETPARWRKARRN